MNRSDVLDARARIQDRILTTPLITDLTLSERLGRRVL